MKKFLRYFKQLAPWCVAIGIFVYLFHLYPPARVWESLKYVNIPAFAVFSIAYFGFLFLVDSWSTQRIITRFTHPVEFKDIFMSRGVTYLIMIINYPASQAAFAYYLKRKYGIAIFKALGVFLFIIFVDLLWIITLAFAGSFFQDITIAGVDLARTVQVTAIIAYAIAFIWVAFWRRLPERVIGKHIRIPIIERMRERKIFHIFNQASIFDYIKTGLMRLPIHFTIIISMYVVLRTFHTSIPFVKILGNVPVVFLVGTLPITPGGLGTTNALMVEFLSPYLTGAIFSKGTITPKELLFTSTLLWMFANYLLKTLTGSILLRGVSKDLFKPTEDVPEDVAEKDARRKA